MSTHPHAQVLPEWVLVISLVVLLGYTAHSTLDKGFKVYNRETLAMKQGHGVNGK
jgi:hypothetical protein